MFLVGACGSQGGPLTNDNSGGQSDFPYGSALTSPGQPADFTIYVINTAQNPVTLVSASLIPISGHPAGRLMFVMVPKIRGNGIAGRGWPIPGLPGRPFRGVRLRHGLYTLIFGFAGNRIGGYHMSAGLRLVYRYQGQDHVVLAWSAGVACVTRDWRTTGDNAACGRAAEVARRATERLSGA